MFKILILVHTSLIIGGCDTVHTSKLNKLPDEIKESSGLIVENRNSFWTHNDGGNEPILYNVDSSGHIIKTVRIEAKNIDWEEITLQNDTVYIGDFGNNLNSRKNLRILYFPFADLKNSTVKPKIIEFTYEDQTAFPPGRSGLYYDCEAMICTDDTIWLFTKNRTRPFDGLIRVYAIPAKAGRQVARHINTIDSGGKIMFRWWITGATIAGNDVFLVSTNKLIILRNFMSDKRAFKEPEVYQMLLFSQKEAVCFDGIDRLYMTDEKLGLTGGNLFYVLTQPIK